MKRSILKTAEGNTFRPVQMVHSFEGLINGTDAIEVADWGRKGSLDCSNFEERVRTELKRMAQKGIGGIVVNYDYADGYLVDEQGWERFISGCEIAVELGMKIWLYDEYGHISGYAGGLTLEGHPEYEAQGLKQCIVENPEMPFSIELDQLLEVYAVFAVDENGARKSVSFEQQGETVSVAEEKCNELEIYFITPLNKWLFQFPEFNRCKRPINLLDSRAIDRFLSFTHLGYFKRIPARLWEHVEAIFTDEPFMVAQHKPKDGDNPFFLSVPWSYEVERAFLKHAGYQISEHIHSLFGGDSSGDRQARKYYRAGIAELCERSYERISTACSAIGIDLTGHILGASSIYANSFCQGNFLRNLSLFQRPGIDQLSSDPERVQNKKSIFEGVIASSAATLGNRKKLMVEVSEYLEYWTKPERAELMKQGKEFWLGERNANSLDEIKHTIAFLFLFGITEFSFYYIWRSFSDEEYKEITDFAEMLTLYGRESMYCPDTALYYPVEMIWEELLPQEKIYNSGEGYELQSARLKQINDSLVGTVRELFMKNVQFILCDSSYLHRLTELGINHLLISDHAEPEQQVIDFCNANDIALVTLNEAVDNIPECETCSLNISSENNVVFNRTDRFWFCLNLERTSASVSFDGEVSALFPSRGNHAELISGQLELDPLEGVFLFT